jgi:triacylglycerol lipase
MHHETSFDLKRRMLARLQQFTTLGMLAVATLWAVWCWRADHAGWALAGAALMLFSYALVLAVEFMLLRRSNRLDPAPTASTRQLLRAWWGEVLAAPSVFCWRQPFRSGRWPDHMPADARGRRGVVLIHGFFCNRGIWNPWLSRLHAADVPFVAVNLEPIFGSIDHYVDIVEAAVCRIEQSTGLAPVLVGHSMGGLALRRWWADAADAHRVHHAITIGTPHRGTWLARFAFSTNGRQMHLASEWHRALGLREAAGRAAKFTCFYGHCDNIVFPASNATLPGADNRHLQAVAHVHMNDRPEPYAELLRWLAAPTKP